MASVTPIDVPVSVVTPRFTYEYQVVLVPKDRMTPYEATELTGLLTDLGRLRWTVAASHDDYVLMQRSHRTDPDDRVDEVIDRLHGLGDGEFRSLSVDHYPAAHVSDGPISQGLNEHLEGDEALRTIVRRVLEEAF